MIDLPKLRELDVSEKRVIVRMDFDLPAGKAGTPDVSRIEASKETLEHLLKNRAKIILIGHKGRPSEDRERGRDLSLSRLASEVGRILQSEVKFVYDLVGQEANDEAENLSAGYVMMLENLRFDPREEANDENFARQLAGLAEVYVNEAFAVSHRAHASIVGIPKILKEKQQETNYRKNVVAAGFRFEKEIEMLSRVIENPERPLVFIISGIKEDKLEMIEKLVPLANKILVGGRLPELLFTSEESRVASEVLRSDSPDGGGKKIVVAQLNPDKEDITIHSVERFEEEIERARTIVLAGVVGKVEDEGHQLGTKRVFTKVANANAYKVAGGGDTEAALTKFGLTQKFNWISVGGGAMLEYLSKKTLPGIEALLS